MTAQDAEPDYIFPQKNPEGTRKKITNYWIKRWLTSRINYAPALEALANFTPRDGAVSSELRTDEAQTQLNLDV